MLDLSYCHWDWTWQWLRFPLEYRPALSWWTCLLIPSQVCTNGPAAPAVGLWGLGPGEWERSALQVLQLLVGGFLFLMEHLVPTVLSHLFSFLICICLCKTKLLYTLFYMLFLLLSIAAHPFTSTHLLTCWWTVSLLLSFLGWENHVLAFQWYESIRED